jgi:ornithine cyclodeaminase
MLHISDELIERHVSAADVEAVMRDAFICFSDGSADMQERIRTEAGGVKLSTLGAVIPPQGVAGAKIYTTIAGQFRFVILIFSTKDGRPLASLDAGVITRLRTAACSVLAARQFARKDAEIMALFGAGVQGIEHAQRFSQAFGLKRILVCDPYAAPDLAARLTQSCGIPVEMSTPEQATPQADILVTASRSTEPLFSGHWLKKGAFIAAIGSSLPQTRELDDIALSRASAVIVEWSRQTMREAGDFVRADPAALPQRKIYELGDVLSGSVRLRRDPGDIVIYKAVGVGLQDVALAGLAYRRIAEAGHAQG